ncbi:tetratricopeptide repeat-containing sensor histidine kinase [Dyadobacter aurulentus]|uniref:tetratricopeptide repeat-containing sensor histidine kinase n=1 Tax=Dyadobacter sp. UC 10 TaxID=2605428 RepID=UPI0011F245AD|nr:sensor histidine kinase [Dyadobacter sp. UC 10]KAA0993631.1 tetratricopeptide repeat protein [Dyadobacter sp. UC 10]
MSFIFRLLPLFAIAVLLAESRCSQDKSIVSLTEAAILQKEDFAEDTALILKYHKLGASYLFLDADKSMLYAKHVLRLSQKHDWKKGKILAYNLLSTYYLLDGSYDVLRELSNETMILSQELGLPYYTAHAQRFMAESYSEFRHWDSARINYNQAIRIFTQLGADSARAFTMVNLGNCYREKKLNDQAIHQYNQAYAIFDKLNSDWGKAAVLQEKGYLKVREQDFKAAVRYFKTSLALSQKNKNRYGELNTLNDLSNTYYHQKEYDKSIQTCLEAFEHSKIYHSTQQTNWALTTLSRAYKAKNMYDSALYYNEQVNNSRRMVHDETVKRQYTMYQLMYDNQVMDSEIQQGIIKQQRSIQQFLIGFSALIIAFAAFLWFNNKKLRRKNAEIREALIQGQTLERKRVAAELHDHLGGTLASLNWYMYGIDKKVLSLEEQKIYDSVHQMVGSAYREVRSLSHNLMPAELEEHGLIMALDRLISKLNENKNIQFEFNLTGLESRLNNKIEFELYSIVLELTNNIIKHSGATTARIELTENAKSILLCVSDNGTGMIDSGRQGTGLRNVKSRVESLHGKINIQHNETLKGTKVEIEIPGKKMNL